MFNNKAVDQLVLEYGSLGDEQTLSGELCPVCEGGASQERTLSVTLRSGVLLWLCHRASCGFSGSTAVVAADGRRTTGEGTKSKSSRLNIVSLPLNRATAVFFATKFGIPEESVELAGLRWTGDDDGKYSRRVHFPIYGPDSKERGASYRSYQGATPKNLIVLKNDDSLTLSWYRWRRDSSSLVIVEDQVSAIKMAPYLDAVALLGTNLSEAKVEEIREEKYNHIFLCLDNDATMVAVKTQLKWRNKLPHMCVQGLGRDIKDMNDEEFADFLRAVAPNTQPCVGTTASSD